MEVKPVKGPHWIIRMDKDNYQIWLAGGCIDSIEALDDTEEMLRFLRPLMQAKEETRKAIGPETAKDEHA